MEKWKINFRNWKLTRRRNQSPDKMNKNKNISFSRTAKCFHAKMELNPISTYHTAGSCLLFTFSCGVQIWSHRGSVGWFVGCSRRGCGRPLFSRVRLGHLQGLFRRRGQRFSCLRLFDTLSLAWFFMEQSLGGRPWTWQWDILVWSLVGLLNVVTAATATATTSCSANCKKSGWNRFVDGQRVLHFLITLERLCLNLSRTFWPWMPR